MIAIGVLLSIFRFSIENNNTMDLVFVMSIINTIAFDYVLLLIIVDISKIVENNIENSSFSKEQQKKYKNKLNIMLCIFSLFVFIIISIIYVVILRSGALNDIISIMALVISVSQNKISDFLGEKIYNIL